MTTNGTGGERTVPQDANGRRLDGVVRQLFDLPWSKARRYVQDAKLFIDGVSVTDGGAAVQAGTTIVLRLDAPRPGRSHELPGDALVHLDAHVIVVNKPAGVSTVPYLDGERGTLDERVRNLIARRLRTKGRAAGGPPPLGVVHRLDKETTGLLVFARTWLAKQSLAAQFRAHSVHRVYLALAHGDVRETTYRSHLVSDRGDGRRGSLPNGPGGSPPNRGQPAVTHVKPIERPAGATLIALRLETGRTHQIRIHLSEAGHPLLGEKVYMRGFTGPILEAPRVMLHAAELGFVHPVEEKPMRFRRPIPEDMRAVLVRLRRERGR